MKKSRLLWTIWPSHRDPVTARTVAPWPAIVEARFPGGIELAGYDGQFYTGRYAVCPSRFWTFRSRKAAQAAYDLTHRNRPKLSDPSEGTPALERNPTHL